MRVPCGQCLSCKIAKAREWATRCVHEAAYHRNTSFVTLTYSDEAIPEKGSLRKRHLERVLKRIRRSVEPERIKVFGCGEYGGQTLRPHYHLILFGVSDPGLVARCWTDPGSGVPYGHVHSGTVTYNSARYVADYVHKKYENKAHWQLNGLEEPFQVISRGIGLKYVEEHGHMLVANGMKLQMRGRSAAVPRYYHKKLEHEMAKAYKKRIAQERRLEAEEKYEELEEELVYPTILAENRQRRKNSQARQEMRGGKV